MSDNPSRFRAQDPGRLTNYSVQRRRITDSSLARLEIYKFVVPVLIMALGTMLYLELNSIRESGRAAMTGISTLNSSVSTMSAQIIDIQQNANYTRDRLDRMEHK